ncbi:glycosyl hydrolase family 28 protein [Streptomyces sp. NPDC006654]|uniref:glycosyl hydrolase family 28 protein n=1 Tax=Streptomyces sp. NPDC006654 TaxID=3156897 RepID=UPI0033EA0154
MKSASERTPPLDAVALREEWVEKRPVKRRAARSASSVPVIFLGALLVLVAMLGLPTPAHAAPAPIDVYPAQAIYEKSVSYRLTANGREVPVTQYHGYDIAQFAMGEGTTKLTLTKINNTSIGSYSISPAKLNLSASVSGPNLTFTVSDDEYLIVKVDGRPRIVIAIDPAERDRPASSGVGTFNVRSAPYSATPGSDYATASFQSALDDASAWGSANGRQGTVYVPAGVYTLGNLYLRSNLILYLEPGAVLRYTGERAHYGVHWHKQSQNRDITWFISTRYSSKNISVHGRGVIDGNGEDSLRPGNLGANLLVPIYTTNFDVNGVTFRESSSWAVTPIRSSKMTFRNIKIFNRFDMGENDGIDVMESTDVTVNHAIAIGLDDPFSTKTWADDTDLFRNIPGVPRPLSTVVFDDLVSWTYCYGVKVGQGVIQPQSDITFRHVVVYDSAVAIGVHHKYGSAAATNIRFEDIDIERTTNSNDGNRTWLAVWTGDTLGVGPISVVTLSNIRVRDAGTTPARVNGQPGAPVVGLSLDRVYMPGASAPATTLSQMRLTNLSHHGPIAISS